MIGEFLVVTIVLGLLLSSFVWVLGEAAEG